MKKIIMKKVEEGYTLKILGQVYAWIGLACAIFLLCFPEFDYTNVGLTIKMIIVLAFMYGKNNWRMFVMAISAFTVAWSLFTVENILGLVDVAGFSIIFWYALKYRK